jgi:hypothetical protein
MESVTMYLQEVCNGVVSGDLTTVVLLTCSKALVAW